MFVVHSFMNGICNLLVSVCNLGNLGKQCFPTPPPSPPSTFFFSLKDEGLFSLVFFSVSENMVFNFFSKPVFEAPTFKKHSEADSLTPSFALVHYFFGLGLK